MAGININDYNNRYNQDYSSLFSGMTDSKTTSGTGLGLTDYAAIRNGSYSDTLSKLVSNEVNEEI